MSKDSTLGEGSYSVSHTDNASSPPCLASCGSMLTTCSAKATVSKGTTSPAATCADGGRLPFPFLVAARSVASLMLIEMVSFSGRSPTRITRYCGLSYQLASSLDPPASSGENSSRKERCSLPGMFSSCSASEMRSPSSPTDLPSL